MASDFSSKLSRSYAIPILVVSGRQPILIDSRGYWIHNEKEEVINL